MCYFEMSKHYSTENNLFNRKHLENPRLQYPCNPECKIGGDRMDGYRISASFSKPVC